MRIAVTGGAGFIGQNLRVRLGELGHADVVNITRQTGETVLRAALSEADLVFHLAGVNRPKDVKEFDEGNAGLTETVCDTLRTAGRRATLVYASSTQATLDNPYGRSKRASELAVERYGSATGAPAVILRLSNVFGKWCRPDYNSAVATFCHNIARGLPITVNDPAAPLRLVYIDDVVDAMIRVLPPAEVRSGVVEVEPVYQTTVGDVASALTQFAESRSTLTIPRVGTGFMRALYSTYVSYLPPESFAYGLQRKDDSRGMFAEVLRTLDSGQFSYFTAPPGSTRGEHYHHTKTEKFLVVKGTAQFAFRHIVTGETFAIQVEDDDARVVETVPGWAHSIANVGPDEMVVLLWANEVFDPANPDTITVKVDG